jgi:ATP-binding cassette, subfamily F, member 3
MIIIKDLTLQRGTRVVLSGAELTIHASEKVGLVGRNGAGKSSLFALLARRLQPDRGDVTLPPAWLHVGGMAEVEQSMPETSQGASDYVVEGDAVLLQATRALADAEARDDGDAMAHAHADIDEAQGFSARSRAQAMLLGLGFKREQLDAPVDTFSGGWRMRLQLARALMAPAQLLLLDEPTNHLDLDALVWLESWLKASTATLVVISHDRDFLDAITTTTVHVDEGKLERYGGNYSTFEETRAQRVTLQQQAFSKQQERIAHLQKFIDRFKAKASKAKQAQSRVKALARMERVAPMLTAADFAFDFREPLSTPDPMLRMKEVQCGYPPATAIVHNVKLTVMAGQRLGILGANGQGKSTFVKTVARALTPLQGELMEGKGLKVGYFAQQEMDLLDAQDTPWQHMSRLAREAQVPGQDPREQAVRNFLGQFSFAGDMVHQRVGTLSGGERARLVLASIVWQRPNLLLLDEPTNHLDLTTREALSMAINGFDGAVMLVSHDRALLREVCDEFLIVADGHLQPFEGDLEDYQRWLLDVSRAVARGLPTPAVPGSALRPPAVPGSALRPPAVPASVKPSPAAPTPSAPKQVLSPATSRDDRQAAKQARISQADATRPLRNELKRIDERMALLNTERASIDGLWAQGDVAGDQHAELGRRMAHVQAELSMLEERWLELGAQLEALAPSPP